MSRHLNYPSHTRLIAAVLIAVFVVTAALSVRGKSSTWDEPMHLVAGISYLQTGDPRLNTDHPPLARLLGALPTFFIPIDRVSEKSPIAWENADLLNAPNELIGDFEDRLLWMSRLTMLSLSVLLGALLYAWGSQLFGSKAALLPLSLFVFCPPLIANAPIVATDLANTTFVFSAVYGWWRYLQIPSVPRLLWTCLAVAAAFTTKFTAILLIPIFFVLGVLSWVGTGKKSCHSFNKQAWIVGGAWLAIGIAVWFGINLIYGFDGSFLTPPEYLVRAQHLHIDSSNMIVNSILQLNSIWPSWLPVPLPFYYMIIVFSQIVHVTAGHLTYFLGEASTGGWSNYFALLLLIKLPLASLLLIGLGAVLAIRRFPEGAYNLSFLLLPPLLLIWIASNGKLQIGIRHILPAMPFLFLLSGYIMQEKLNRWHQAVIGLLVVSTAWSTYSVHPYYLMYYNFLAGGPEQGWRISVEGDDWGQGGADLTRWLKVHHVKQLAFGAFGWSAIPLYRAGIAVKPVPCEDNGELVAIHAGTLLRTFTLDQAKCYAWMRLRQPDEKIGYSIFLYNTRNAGAAKTVNRRPPPPADVGDFNRALQLQLAGQLEPAIQLYQDYLKREPNYYQARFNLGHALMAAGRCVEAIEEFQRTLALWPGYAETHLHLAHCYRELGQEEAAQRHEKAYTSSQ